MEPQKKIQLRVLGISYSQIQSGAYALILAQIDGPYRIPVVIGATEAQSIAIRMENIIPPRPMTHDLFVSFAHAFGVRLKEVLIYKFEDGIFSSNMTFTDGERQVIIDSRTSDAIGIAMRTKAPIYTTPEILNETGFLLEDEPDEDIDSDASDGNSDDNHGYSDGIDEDGISQIEPKLENYAIEELERTLEKLIAKERYEEASKVSEILKRKRGNKL